MTVNAVPPALGVNVLGETVHVGGAPVPQLRLTELLYPLAVLSEPLNTDAVLTTPVRAGFVIVKA